MYVYISSVSKHLASKKLKNVKFFSRESLTSFPGTFKKFFPELSAKTLATFTRKLLEVKENITLFFPGLFARISRDFRQHFPGLSTIVSRDRRHLLFRRCSKSETRLWCHQMCFCEVSDSNLFSALTGLSIILLSISVPSHTLEWQPGGIHQDRKVLH